MRLRKLATGAVLAANLVVLVATSKEGDDYGYYDTGRFWDTGFDGYYGTDTTTDPTWTDGGTDYTTEPPDRDTGYPGTTEPPDDVLVRTDVAGPVGLAFDAGIRTVSYEVALDVGQELIDAGSVAVYLDIRAEHALAANAALSVYDLANPADPLPETPLASTTVLAAAAGAPEIVDLFIQLPIVEAGISVHYLVLELAGDGELAGEATFTLRAETPSPMPLPPLVIEVH